MENILPKSGSGQSNVNIPDINIDDMIINIRALITLFIENAIKNAELYTLHSNRKVIVPEDISRCLKAELFIFLDRPDNKEQALSIIEKYKNFELLNNTDLEEDFDFDFDYDFDFDNDKLFSEIVEHMEEYKISNCNCNECLKINKYNEEWINYFPTNNVEKLLYDVIQKIDFEFNI